jgi:hypothetical protein
MHRHSLYSMVVFRTPVELNVQLLLVLQAAGVSHFMNNKNTHVRQ